MAWHPLTLQNVIAPCLNQYSYSMSGAYTLNCTNGVRFQAWSGSPPTDPTQTPAGTLLGTSATIGGGGNYLSQPWIPATGGLSTLYGPVAVPITASGTVGFIRVRQLDSGGSLSTAVLDIPAALSGETGFAICSSLTATSGATINITALGIQQGATLANSTLRPNTTLRNALVNAARWPESANHPQIFGFGGSSLVLYGGTQVADGDTAHTATELVRLNQTVTEARFIVSGAAGAWSGGAMSLGNALASGSPTWGSMLHAGKRLDFSCGTQAGVDITLSSATTTAGQPISIVGGLITF